jgi:hypothetical protein
VRRAYLLVYSDLLGSRIEVTDCVDSIPEVYTWRYDMPNSFYLISDCDATEIAEAIREYLGNKGRFIVAEVNDNRNGWLPPKTWHLLRHKSHK